MRSIGVQQIEKSPGANRDVSRIVQSYPGVSFSPAGYRNDLIVRGVGHLRRTASMSMVSRYPISTTSPLRVLRVVRSIINADLVQGIDFYSSAFPVQRSGALSSVMDVRLRDGDSERQSFKVTLGASEGFV